MARAAIQDWSFILLNRKCWQHCGRRRGKSHMSGHNVTFSSYTPPLTGVGLRVSDPSPSRNGHLVPLSSSLPFLVPEKEYYKRVVEK